MNGINVNSWIIINAISRTINNTISLEFVKFSWMNANTFKFLSIQIVMSQFNILCEVIGSLMWIYRILILLMDSI